MTPPRAPSPHRSSSAPTLTSCGPARSRSNQSACATREVSGVSLTRLARLLSACAGALSCLLCAAQAAAITVGVAPLSTPHLNDTQTHKQTQSLSAALNRLSGVKATALVNAKSPQRLLGAPQLDLKALHRDEQRARSLCERLSVDLLVFTEMRLGDDDRPARLVARVFQCASGAQSATEVSFGGKLNSQLWRDVARAIDPLLESTQAPPSGGWQGGSQGPSRGAQGYPGSGYEAGRGGGGMAPEGMRPLEPLPPLPPPQAPSLGAQPIGAQRPLSPPSSQPMGSTPSSDSLPALSIWGGTHTLNPSFTLESKSTSTALKRGIAYSSRWLFGWGGRARLAPFGGGLRFFSVEGEVSHFRFNTLQVIPNLFDRDTTLDLPSEALIWSAGARFSVPLLVGERSHWISARAGWQRSVMSVAYNAEFNGLSTNALDIHITGQLTLVSKRSWLELGGRVRPLIDLGASVQEIGERVSSFGFGFDLAWVLRSAAGLSLRLGTTISITSHSPSGQGRSGRLAESASEQVILGGAELGWVTD